MLQYGACLVVLHSFLFSWSSSHLYAAFAETMEGINATPIKEVVVSVSFPPDIKQLIVPAEEGLHR